MSVENIGQMGELMGKTVVRFEDLDVWKEGMSLAKDLYQSLENCKDYGLKNQLQRSVVSIPSNIAEGFERNTNKEFIQFLYFAKGSCGELRTQLYIAKFLRIIPDEIIADYIERARFISSMLFRLIETRRNNFN